MPSIFQMQSRLSLLPGIFGIFSIGMFSSGAKAEEPISGAKYLCDAKAGTFELQPDERYGDNAPGSTESKVGFKTLPYGETRLKCDLGKRRVLANIEIHEPSNAQCEAVGMVEVESLTVGEVTLLKVPTAFNWECAAEDLVVRILIRVKSNGVDYVECKRKSISSADYSPEENCSTTFVEFHKTAAETFRSPTSK